MEICLAGTQRAIEQRDRPRIDVCRRMGPGRLETVYRECMCMELADADLPFQGQVMVTYPRMGAPKLNDGLKPFLYLKHS